MVSIDFQDSMTSSIKEGIYRSQMMKTTKSAHSISSRTCMLKVLTRLSYKPIGMMEVMAK